MSNKLEKKSILIKDSSLSSLDTFKEEIFEELKKAKYNDHQDMVYRFQLTFDEITDTLDLKYIPTKRIGFSLNPGVYEVSDINTTLKYILPNIVKVTITIDAIRNRSNVKKIQTSIFTSLYYIRIYSISPRAFERYRWVPSNITLIIRKR